jgi:hypothetical protein
MKYDAVFRKMLTSFFVSAAILAIASIDTVVHENGRGPEFARERIKLAKDRLRQRLEIVEPKADRPRGLVNMLRDSLAQDEFGETLPFANLTTFDPLLKVLGHGVAHFDRTVFRSPDYQGEDGYDLVQYEIEHPDGKHSTILAYLDRPLLTVSHNVGAPDPRIPVVMVLESQGESSVYSLYRSGNLVEQSPIPTADVSGLVAQRISLSIPFLSVSR